MTSPLVGYPYTISCHRYSLRPLKDHYDLFIDINSDAWNRQKELDINSCQKILHFTFKKMNGANGSATYPLKRGQPHRRLYLSYQGNIARNRGVLSIVERGRIYLPPNMSLESHIRLKSYFQRNAQNRAKLCFV